MYLSGCANTKIAAAAHELGLGLMLNPENGYGQGKMGMVQRFPAFAIDNGCFSQGERFNADAWLAWLERLSPFQPACLFAVAPDVYHPSGMWQGVTIAQATLERSAPYLPQIRALGFPAALVAQNGLEDLVEPDVGFVTTQETPDGPVPLVVRWDDFDVLFIGGDTAWKLSFQATWITQMAKANGKAVHVGRVNSFMRWNTVAQMGADTCDGTYLKYGPDTNLPRLKRWLKAA